MFNISKETINAFMGIEENKDLAKAKEKRAAKAKWKKMHAKVMKRVEKEGAYGVKKAPDKKNPGKEINIDHMVPSGHMIESKKVYTSGDKGSDTKEIKVKNIHTVTRGMKKKKGEKSKAENEAAKSKLSARVFKKAIGESKGGPAKMKPSEKNTSARPVKKQGDTATLAKRHKEFQKKEIETRGRASHPAGNDRIVRHQEARGKKKVKGKKDPGESLKPGTGRKFIKIRLDKKRASKDG